MGCAEQRQVLLAEAAAGEKTRAESTVHREEPKHNYSTDVRRAKESPSQREWAKVYVIFK